MYKLIIQQMEGRRLEKGEKKAQVNQLPNEKGKENVF
jgi:hypothetical protein